MADSQSSCAAALLLAFRMCPVGAVYNMHLYPQTAGDSSTKHLIRICDGSFLIFKRRTRYVKEQARENRNFCIIPYYRDYREIILIKGSYEIFVID